MLERLTMTDVGRSSAFDDWTGREAKDFRVVERRGLAIIELAAFGQGEAARAALSGALGIDLPGPGASSEAGGVAALSIGPGRWLLIATEAAISNLPTPKEDEAAVTDLSGGRSILSLSGGNSVRTLMKGTAVDLHPGIFAPGSVAATALARMAVVIWRRGATHDVIVPRSYAVAMRDWLIASGAV
jgi:heterotetrameric sarcosine oxidase gamma subunit